MTLDGPEVKLVQQCRPSDEIFYYINIGIDINLVVVLVNLVMDAQHYYLFQVQRMDRSLARFMASQVELS